MSTKLPTAAEKKGGRDGADKRQNFSDSGFFGPLLTNSLS